MTDAQWIAEMQRQARQECEICAGRRFGDCSDQCRYFLAGTQQEARETPWRGRMAATRGWLGPMFIGREEEYAE